jgi:hypothetical protein
MVAGAPGIELRNSILALGVGPDPLEGGPFRLPIASKRPQSERGSSNIRVRR